MTRKEILNNIAAPLIKLGAKYAAAALGPAGPLVIDVGAAVAGEYGSNKVKEYAAKEDQREFQQIYALVAEQVAAFLEAEHSTVSPEWLSETIRDILNRAIERPKDLGTLGDNKEAWQWWLSRFRPPVWQNRWSSDEEQAVSRCLDFAAGMMARTVLKLPAYLQAIVASHSDQIRRLLETEAKAEQKRIEQEEQYRARVRTDLDQIELFGADMGKDERSFPLSVAYISLRLHSDDTDSYSVADAERLLSRLPDNQRLLYIEGKAGSGKTTLLRWIAITAAARRAQSFERWLIDVAPPRREDERRFPEIDEKAQEQFLARYQRLWYFQVPFLVRMRAEDVVKNGLPLPAQLADWLSGRPNNGSLDTTWLTRLLEQGQVLLMFDGLDEIPARDQKQTLERLDRIVQRWGNNRIILSSRPVAPSPAWETLAQRFQKLTLADLTPPDQLRLIEYWFNALAEKRKGKELPEDKLDSEELLTRKQALLKQLPLHREASQLAKVPLLCAFLCAMFAQPVKGAPVSRLPRLPEKLPDLCKDIVEMLLDKRPNESELRIKEFWPVYGELGLITKCDLLEELAYKMVNTDRSSLSQEQAAAILRYELKGKIPSGDTEDFLHTYVVVSGLLRLGEGGSVEFLHNILKEYLAAQKLIGHGEFATLTKDPATELYQRLSLFASYRKETRERVFKALLEPEKPWSAEQQDAANLLALRCWGLLELRTQFRDRLLDLREQYVPPKNALEAESIAVEGDVLVPRLQFDPNHTPEVAAACIQALYRIDTAESHQALEEYAAKEERFPAVEALADCMNPLFIRWLQQRIHSENSFFFMDDEEKSIRSRVSDSHLIEYLEWLKSSEKLPEVEILNLNNTQVAEIKGLAACTNLQRLSLNNTQVAEIKGLAACTNLQTLYLNNTQVAEIKGLAACTNLQRLSLDNTQVAEIKGLAACTNLQTLSLDNTQVAEIKGLAACTNLQTLYLDNTQVAEIKGLAACTNLQTLYLDNTQVAEIKGLEKCPELKWLSLNNTQVSQESIQAFKSERGAIMVFG